MTEDHSPENDPEAQDDEVIAKAFNWSLKFILIAVITAGFIYAVISYEPAAEPIKVGPNIPTLQRGANDSAPPPEILFTDINQSSGLNFTHDDGARGEKLLPETMGSGCAFGDVDGAGDSDLFLASGKPWPWTGEKPKTSTLRLWLNDGSGGFTEVTEEWNLNLDAYCTGLALGDVDGDSDLDIFVAAVGSDQLLINEGGSFKVKVDSGTSGESSAWSSSAGFFDADGDQDLDLFVCQYVQWSRQKDMDVDYKLTGVGRAYGPPTNFEGSACRLHLNDGSGKFEDVSETAGLNSKTLTRLNKALALVPADIDFDGDVDIIVANDTTRNFVFKNRGDATFEEVGVETGLAYDGNGSATGAMGLDVTDFRNDGSVGIAVANFAAEMTGLYRSIGSSELFMDESVNEGIGPPSRKALSFGLLFLDADLDGRQDLIQANGHLEEGIELVQPGQKYRQKAQFFWNCGLPSGCFKEIPPEKTGDLSTPAIGRGLSCADIDGDGDLDLLLTQVGEPALLLRNDQNTDHHWIQIDTRLISPGSWIECQQGEKIQRQLTGQTRSYLSQCEAVTTFGFGSDDTLPTITIREVGKIPVSFTPDALNQRVSPPR